MNSDLRVWTETHDQSVVVRAAGEVDMRTVAELEAEVDRVCAAPGSEVLVIDLNEITFFGSTGLALLESTLRQCRERGRTLRVVAGNRAVVRPLQMMGMDDKLELVPTQEEALIGTS